MCPFNLSEYIWHTYLHQYTRGSVTRLSCIKNFCDQFGYHGDIHKIKHSALYIILKHKVRLRAVCHSAESTKKAWENSELAKTECTQLLAVLHSVESNFLFYLKVLVPMKIISKNCPLIANCRQQLTTANSFNFNFWLNLGQFPGWTWEIYHQLQVKQSWDNVQL